MFSDWADSFWTLMQRGGPVMWPLLVLSLVGVTLVVERAWFWLSTNSPGRPGQLARWSRLLRENQTEQVRRAVEGDQSVYGRAVRQFVSEPMSDAVFADAVESQRPRLERFMPTLSTIITAAPMLGILGTVTGIINSFQALSIQATATDPKVVGAGIAEALITTAAGLVVAIAILFPYNAFRAQIDRTLGRIEMLAAAAMRHHASSNPSSANSAPPGQA